MNAYKLICIDLILVLSCHVGFSQTDSLIFSNGDAMVGEIKSMDRGSVIVENDYSDDDFKIDWEEVTKVFTESRFLITLTNGSKYYGSLSTNEDLEIQIRTKEEKIIQCIKDDIVYLSPVEDKFIDRLSASIDVGVDMTKTQNLRSFTSRGSFGYWANKWTSDLSFSSLHSSQDETEDIIRTEAALSFRLMLLSRWYLIGTVSGLSNTEQKLDLRMNAQLGFGHIFFEQTEVIGEANWGLIEILNNIQVKEKIEIVGKDTWERN